MRLAGGTPSHWRVTPRDGSKVEVWADMVTGLSGDEDQRDYEFGVVVDLAPDDQTEYDVSAKTLPIRDGAVVTVARFPRASVIDVNSV